jgi:hypothetical protein
MMDTLMIKLQGLEKHVQEWLHTFHGGKANNFDPRDVADLFARYESISKSLRSEYPLYFSELPVREVKSSGTTDFEGRGYIKRSALEILLMDIGWCLNALLGMSIYSESPVKATREGLFFAGQYYDAIRWVGDIILKAQREIIVVDGYVDTKTLDLLSAKKPEVEAKILTKDVSAALKAAAMEFNKQYGRLQIRESSAFHDRFIVVDQTDFYHLGASVKNLGNRGFMFSRIEEPEIIKAFSEGFAKEWQSAAVRVPSSAC